LRLLSAWIYLIEQVEAIKRKVVAGLHCKGKIKSKNGDISSINMYLFWQVTSRICTCILIKPSGGTQFLAGGTSGLSSSWAARRRYGRSRLPPWRTCEIICAVIMKFMF
jgi:hypothetical protein